MQFTLAVALAVLSFCPNALAARRNRFTEVTRITEVMRQKPVHQNDPVAYLQTFSDDECRGSDARHYVILRDQANECRNFEFDQREQPESTKLVFVDSEYEVSVFDRLNCEGDDVEIPEPRGDRAICEPAEENDARSWKSVLVVKKKY